MMVRSLSWILATWIIGWLPALNSDAFLPRPGEDQIQHHIFKHGQVQMSVALPKRFRRGREVRDTRDPKQWQALLTFKSHSERVELLWVDNPTRKDIEDWQSGFDTFHNNSYTEVRKVDIDPLHGRIARFHVKISKGVHLPTVSAKSYLADAEKLISMDYYSDAEQALSMAALVKILESIKIEKVSSSRSRHATRARYGPKKGGICKGCS